MSSRTDLAILRSKTTVMLLSHFHSRRPVQVQPTDTAAVTDGRKLTLLSMSSVDALMGTVFIPVAHRDTPSDLPYYTLAVHGEPNTVLARLHDGQVRVLPLKALVSDRMSAEPLIVRIAQSKMQGAVLLQGARSGWYLRGSGKSGVIDSAENPLAHEHWILSAVEPADRNGPVVQFAADKRLFL